MAKTINEAPELVWVSRDADGTTLVDIWTTEPTCADGVFDSEYEIFAYPSLDHFERHTNLRLEPGECVQVRIYIEVVKS